MTNEKLIELQNIVLPVMRILALIDQDMEKKLKEIPLGLIRKNATRMHAVCRFKRGPKGYTKTIDDVKEVANDVLNHRIILNYEAEAEGIKSEFIISKILEKVEINS